MSTDSGLDEILAKQLQAEFDKEYSEELKKWKEENKFPEDIGNAVVVYLDDLWNNRNFKVVDDALTSDCVCRGPFGEIVGRNDFKTKVALPLFDAFPDIKFVNHETFQEGRRIVNRWTFTGTFSGKPYEGFIPNNQKIVYHGVTINRFGETNQIEEMHTFYDRESLFEQLSKK